MPCPQCGAVEVIPIVYGFPLAGSGLMQAADAGEVFLGGCVVHDDQPYWRCQVCGFEGGGEHHPETDPA